MKTKQIGKSGFMTMKLDMSKAYVCIEWSFLCQLVVKMGFNDWWMNMIMECVNSVSYSILVNGEPQGDIKTTSGISNLKGGRKSCHPKQEGRYYLRQWFKQFLHCYELL